MKKSKGNDKPFGVVQKTDKDYAYIQLNSYGMRKFKDSPQRKGSTLKVSIKGKKDDKKN